jgi:predicted hotdog family 3-hydroxylacyl-ACP dehydratase
MKIDSASLIPHRGSMCLLERVVEWDERSIVLETSTHRSAANPLRMNGRLRAVHLCEYGAQAMAVHGALKSRAAGEHAAPGLLVSLRSVSFAQDYIENLPCDLRVEAHALQAGVAGLQYDFRVTHSGQWLATGRAAVMLGQR